MKQSYYVYMMFAFLLNIQSTYASQRYQYLDKMPHDRYSNITLSGDIFSNALPTIAILSQLNDQSNHNYNDLLIASSVFLSTDLLKRSFNNTPLGMRPNGYHSSFPSGHSSSAFLGARLIHKRYGIQYGIPAYALATYTAYTRVQGHYHHVRDVVAGAALALTIDYLIDHNTPNRWISPIIPLDGKGVGASLSVSF